MPSPSDTSPRPAWRVVGAAVQGTAHEKTGLPCQDALAYWVTPEGAVLIFVADGAGTAEKSGKGAQTAVHTALEALVVGLSQASPQDISGWRALIEASFIQALQALEALAEAEALPLRSFATTLACCVANRDWLVAGQIGDGAVIACTAEEELFLAVLPQRGEYANETYFLTLPDALQRLDVQVYSHPVTALAVMSDGLTRLALQLPEYNPHPQFFAPLLSFASQAENLDRAEEQLAAFLDSDRVCARTDDDKTLVLAVRPDFRGRDRQTGIA
jgi:hypothetical protein